MKREPASVWVSERISKVTAWCIQRAEADLKTSPTSWITFKKNNNNTVSRSNMQRVQSFEIIKKKYMKNTKLYYSIHRSEVESERESRYQNLSRGLSNFFSRFVVSFDSYFCATVYFLWCVIIIFSRFFSLILHVFS